MFTGSSVAVVTPMDGNEVDYAALSDLVEWHIKAGTQAIIAAGTTGESCTLTDDETANVLKTVVDVVAGRVPVIAGTGCNATAKTIENTRAAKALGCDASLVITPYYNKPTQAGLLAHFEAIHQAVDLPMILYNNPSRTAVDMQVATTVALSKLEHVVGIKDATGDLLRLEALKKECQESFKLYSGDDSTAYEFMRAGGHGVISTVANIVPEEMAQLSRAVLAGDEAIGEAMDLKCQPLYKLLAVESNPIPVKWALQAMGKIKPGIRLPLTPLAKEHQLLANSILEKAVGEVHV